MVLSKYSQEAVRICKEYVAKHIKGYRLPKRAENPFFTGYCPKLDVSPVVGSYKSSYCQSLIGVMKWMVEVGYIDINTKVFLLPSYLAMQRQRAF